MVEWMRRRGQRVPEELIEPAEVFDDLIPIWIAWHTLSVSRPVGMTASGIQWCEMSRYCEDYGIAGSERLRWIRLMRAMDAVWLEWQHCAKEDRRGSTRSRD